MNNTTETETLDIEVPEENKLDASGLYCPEPVMMLHNKIREISEGSVLHLLATDPSTTRDVPKFCVYLGHELIKEERDGENFQYWIRKKAEE